MGANNEEKGTVVISWFKKNISARLLGGRFARDVAVLAGGTALGQAITVLASPILTRIYTPEDFSVLAIYSSILSVLSTLAAGRYEVAIPLPEGNKDAVSLVMLALSIVVLMSLLVGLGVWLLGDQIVDWTNASALRPYLWLLPVGVLLVGNYQVFSQWAVRKNAFAIISRTKLSQGLGATTAQIVTGLLKGGPLGLLAGQIIGQSLGILTLATSFQVQKAISTVRLNDIMFVVTRYKRFPMLSVWPTLINAIGLQLPILALSTLHGAQVTGWFALANKIFGVPLSIISTSTSFVMIGQAAEDRRSIKKLDPLFWKVIRQQLFLAIPLLIVTPLCPFVFPFVFGQSWKESGIYATIWAPAIIANFVASPTGGFLDVLERQDLFIFREVLRLLIVSGVLVFSLKLALKPLLMVGMISCSMILFAVLYALISFYAIKQAASGLKGKTC
ncbi:MAG: polysaccharide biosynthesis protein [Ardenticatenia bacterium]|nr:MAG: polysaccharide biosynthesis protein [Ardenticatenia bacterium]